MPRPATARAVTQPGEAAVANASDGQSGKFLNLFVASLVYRVWLLDVSMPEPLLDRSGVVAVVSELVPAGAPEHVRVDREREQGRLADPCQLLAEAGGGHRRCGQASARRARGGVGRYAGVYQRQPISSPVCSRPDQPSGPVQAVRCAVVVQRSQPAALISLVPC
jgi:hypothetical protein